MQYELSNLVATLLPFFVFIAFAVFSVPGGLLAARIGKKKLLLLGLGLNAVALLIPSLQTAEFCASARLHLRARRRHDLPAGRRQSHHARRQSRRAPTAGISALRKASRASAARCRPTWSPRWPASPFSRAWAGAAHSRCFSCSWPWPSSRLRR